MKGKLKAGIKTTLLYPKLIPMDIEFENIRPAEKDLLGQQVLLPSKPFNGYLLLTAPVGSMVKYNKTSFDLYLEFKLEMGKTVNVVLPIRGTMSVQSGENFPSHNIKF